MECTCEVINVKHGHNKELLSKCHRLWEYSEFVSEIEMNIQAGLSREEAVQAAIEHCIQQNILTDILKTEKSEVLHMIFLTEYDEKKHLRHTFEEGRTDKLLEQILKKTAKGKSLETIADELEEDVETIQALIKQYEKDNQFI